MNRAIKGAVVAICLCLPVLAAFPASAGGPGVTGGSSLVFPSGARPAALADAFTAGAGGLEVLGYNPAGLAFLEGAELVTWQGHRLGLDAYSSSLAYGQATEYGTFGAAATTFTAGSVELIDLDNNARIVNAQRDYVYTLSYGKDLQEDGFAAVGGNLKYYRSTLAETATADAFLADVGVQYRLSPVWRGGMAWQNIGGDITYLEQGDPPPARLRGGLWHRRETRAGPLDIYLDLIYRRHERDQIGALGVEYGWNHFVFFRFGVKGNLKEQNVESQRINFGLGFKFKKIEFDYGVNVAENLEDVMHLALKWKF